MLFPYGEAEIRHLSQRDKRLGEALCAIGPIAREVDEDLFSSVVHHIVGQQISAAAFQTVWRRMCSATGEITATALAEQSLEALQCHGISFRKAAYIKNFAQRVASGALAIDGLGSQSDQAVISLLSAEPGIGVWTAEMVLLFGLHRPDILSFGDLGIHRGMRMLYRHRTIERDRFETLRRRYSPCGSVASLYLWAISAGALPHLTDPAPPKKEKGR